MKVWMILSKKRIKVDWLDAFLSDQTFQCCAVSGIYISLFWPALAFILQTISMTDLNFVFHELFRFSIKFLGYENIVA